MPGACSRPTHQTLLEERIGNFRIILYFGADHASAVVNLNWEQVPDEDSRITLDPQQVDPIFGQPVAHVDGASTRLTNEARLVPWKSRWSTCGGMAQTSRDVTNVSGGAADWTSALTKAALETGDHHMGAMRMSASSADGIVNVNSRLHSVGNLYIAGSAVFPAGGYANPTLTIVALALRLADHLKAVILRS